MLKEKDMSKSEKSYWLLSETSGIGETRDPRLQRHLPMLEGLRWLAAGAGAGWGTPDRRLLRHDAGTHRRLSCAHQAPAILTASLH